MEPTPKSLSESYGTQLPTLPKLSPGGSKTSIMASCANPSIATGKIRSGHGTFGLYLSSSELSGSCSEEKSIGTSAEGIGSRRNLSTIMAAFRTLSLEHPTQQRLSIASKKLQQGSQ